jgi:hypothetical protein
MSHQTSKPGAGDIEAAVEAVFNDYPDALLILKSYLVCEVRSKLKTDFPKVTLSNIESAVLRMVEADQLRPFVIVGARSENQAEVIVFKLNPHRLRVIIQFPG